MAGWGRTDTQMTPPAGMRPRLPAIGTDEATGTLRRTLLDVFAESQASYPERTAIDAPDRRLTYAELAEAAGQLARRLQREGIGPGDRVGIYVPSGSTDLHVAILGVLRAGAAYVPVDADDSVSRAEAIWQSSDTSAVIEAGLSLHLRARPTKDSVKLPSPDDDAWIIFTSGSTGAPKGVAVTHGAAAAFVEAEAKLWRIEPDDRVLSGLSVAFDASCEEMWLAWRNGAALVPAPRSLVRAGADLGPWLAQRDITVVSTVPTLAAMWNECDLASVRLLILGGEACPEPLAWQLAEGREVWNTYGPTEATVVSTAARVVVGAPVTIGWPISGWEIAVVDEQGGSVPLGEPGELAIAGVGLGRYLDPALDDAGFAPVPALGCRRAYRTGDVVRESIDGLHFIGRRDDQVKLGARRLELGEVDAQLRSVAGVRAAAAAVQKTAAGNPLLVAYVVGDADPAGVRTALAGRLPHGIAPLVVQLDSLPTNTGGKFDRRALPWPPPAPPRDKRGSPERATKLTETAAWLAERWAEQLGPLPLSGESDFFELGGSSLAVAKLVSVLRSRFPAVAVADVYAHRRLNQLAERLDRLGTVSAEAPSQESASAAPWRWAQLAGVILLIALSSPQWLLGILAFDRWAGTGLGPQVGWGWLIAGGVIFATPFGRAWLVLLARRVLLPSLRPGRYPRRGWLACRLWFLERLADGFRSDSLAGTPFAARFARLCGHRVGAGARLGTLPPVTSLLTIGERATLESDVDAHGWWLDGDELVVGEVRIGAGARIGTRALLGPAAEIGAGAEIEAASVVNCSVPAGERWAGSPARRVGLAGEGWPAEPAPRPTSAWVWKVMFIAGLALQAILPLVAALPVLAFLDLVGVRGSAGVGSLLGRLTIWAPVLATIYLITYGVLVALLVRWVGRLVRPGWHPDEGRIGWVLWLADSLMNDARGVLFSVCASLYMRPWLRLAGVAVGKRAELSTVVGLGRLTSFGASSFAADDVVLATARGRLGWLHVAPIDVGSGTFLGNGAILAGGTELGRDGLIGVLTTAPHRTGDATSWFGSPPLELPRVPDFAEPGRTTDPPRRLVLARGVMDLIRILLPPTISIVLASLLFAVVEVIGGRLGVAAMLAAAPMLLFAAGVLATAFTVAAKWLIIGRYRRGEHPLWSFFVWRDEIMNSLQDQLAGTWLLGFALGTPLMSPYLRAMGARVGRDVWCETLTITEFDMVSLGDGCVINRFACIETHLFHDRIMRIGPANLAAGCSIGPSTAVLPDTVIGAGARVGGRSVVLRGEELPPGSRWRGAPVAAE